MLNRRKDFRPTMVAQVEVALPAKGEHWEGVAINLSRGGMGLYTEKAPEMNTEVVLTLLFHDESGPRAERVAGRVRWIKPIGNLFAIGVQFASLSPAEHPLTLAYLDSAVRFERP